MTLSTNFIFFIMVEFLNFNLKDLVLFSTLFLSLERHNLLLSLMD